MCTATEEHQRLCRRGLGNVGQRFFDGDLDRIARLDHHSMSRDRSTRGFRLRRTTGDGDVAVGAGEIEGFVEAVESALAGDKLLAIGVCELPHGTVKGGRDCFVLYEASVIELCGPWSREGHCQEGHGTHESGRQKKGHLCDLRAERVNLGEIGRVTNFVS